MCNYVMKCIYCHSIGIRYYSKTIEKYKPPWDVLFFGTDKFSLTSLKALNSIYKNGDVINRLEIVTTMKNKANAVYKFAKEENLETHGWPINSTHGFHIGLVVSFGYLIPQSIISGFPLGMLNVHASLLPRWRGAAPIIHAIANGDNTTGITIMRIKPKHFDIGEIIHQETVHVEENVTMPVLYEKLANLGANILIRQLYNLPNNLLLAKSQSNVGITYAPKVTSSFGNINWSTMSAKNIYNLSRALVSLYPLLTSWNGVSVKLYDVQLNNLKLTCVGAPGSVFYDKLSKSLKIQCIDGNWISVRNIGVQNKRTMTASDFNNGYIKKTEEDKRIFR